MLLYVDGKQNWGRGDETSSEQHFVAAFFKLSWFIWRAILWMFPLCPGLLALVPQSHVFCVTQKHLHTPAQTLTLATRSCNCPHRDPMTTYHHHRRHEENFIYSSLLLSRSVFDLSLSSDVALFPVISPFFLYPLSMAFIFSTLFPSSCAVFCSLLLAHPWSDTSSLETSLDMCGRLPE